MTLIKQRIEILKLLLTKAMKYTELIESTNMNEEDMSKQLDMLIKLKMIEKIMDDNSASYKINEVNIEKVKKMISDYKNE